MVHKVGKIHSSFEYSKNIMSSGCFIGSSAETARKATRSISSFRPQIIVELGSGNGEITYQILRRMHENSTLIVFETNKRFCKWLYRSQDKRLKIINQSAVNMVKVMGETAICDSIISSLPFHLMSPKVKNSILRSSLELLKNDGYFVHVSYFLPHKRIIWKHFNNCEHLSICNVPPGLLHIAKKLSPL